jgi:hypothetical protein
MGMREPEIRLGGTRNRLLNRISDRLCENAVNVHRRDLNLLACGEMLANLRDEVKLLPFELRKAPTEIIVIDKAVN